MYWSMDSWGPDYPPEDAVEIVATANAMIERYRETHSDEETRNYSAALWDRYCMTGQL